MLDNPTSGLLGGGDAGADAFPLADFASRRRATTLSSR